MHIFCTVWRDVLLSRQGSLKTLIGWRRPTWHVRKRHREIVVLHVTLRCWLLAACVALTPSVFFFCFFSDCLSCRSVNPFYYIQTVPLWPVMLLTLLLFIIPGGAYVVSNQDSRFTQKNIYTPIFTHHIRSWLLCTPVIPGDVIYPSVNYSGGAYVVSNQDLRCTQKNIYIPLFLRTILGPDY